MISRGILPIMIFVSLILMRGGGQEQVLKNEFFATK